MDDRNKLPARVDEVNESMNKTLILLTQADEPTVRDELGISKRGAGIEECKGGNRSEANRMPLWIALWPTKS